MKKLKIGLNLGIGISALVLISIIISGGFVLELGGGWRISFRSSGNPGFLLMLLILVRLALAGTIGIRSSSISRVVTIRSSLLCLLLLAGYLVYSSVLSLPLFKGGYFIWILGGWLLLIIMGAFGQRLVVKASPSLRLVLVAVLAAIYYLSAYGQEPDAPHHSQDQGIWTRYDQSYYLKMAQGFSHFRLEQENFKYGPGYPILGAPFVFVIPVNPFFIPNMFFYVLSVCCFYLAGTRLLGSPGALLAVALALGPAFVEFFCVPWNSVVSISAVGGLLYLGLSPRKSWLGTGTLIGLLLGWVFATRYIDFFLLLPLGWAGLRGRGWASSLMAVVMAGIIVLLVLAGHWAVLGSPLKTPYYSRQETGIGDQTLAAYRPGKIVSHFYQVFMNPGADRISPEGMRYPVLARAFILVLFPVGLFFLFFYRGAGHPATWSAFVVSLILGWCFYGSFFAGGAFDMIFGNTRYYLPWLPGATIISVYGLECLVPGEVKR